MVGKRIKMVVVVVRVGSLGGEMVIMVVIVEDY